MSGPGVSEAGRDGFWRQRFLRAPGIQNSVVEASSIEVNRRYRRSKTDRLAMQKLLTMRGRVVLGETRVWNVVRGPAAADEALRPPHRDSIALKEERPPQMNRMKGWRAGVGLEAVSDGPFPARLRALRQWDGPPLPGVLQARLLREFARWSRVPRQIPDLEQAAARMVRDDPQPHVAPVRTLMRRRGMGTQAAWRWGREVFGWRAIQNRRALAALAGLTPTPSHAGPAPREPGIRKAGSHRRRWLMGARAWGWWHWHPESARRRWYQARFGQGRARLRQLGIVARARKLLVALGRLVAHGALPPGAVLADGSRQVTGRWATRRAGVAVWASCAPTWHHEAAADQREDLVGGEARPLGSRG